MTFKLEQLHEAYLKLVKASPAPSNAFYREMAFRVFGAGALALADAHHNVTNLQTVPAAPGTGKTTFTNCLIAGRIETLQGSSALVAVQQILTAKTRYRSLHQLLPGKVAVWTSGFRTVASKADLWDFPVAVVTHETLMGRDKELVRKWREGRRTLTIVDERPKGVRTFDITPRDVTHVWQAVSKDRHAIPAAKKAVDALYQFVTKRVLTRQALDHLSNDEALAMAEPLSWFKSRDAAEWLSGIKDKQQKRLFEEVVGFASSLSDNYAFVTHEGNETHLIGYENRLDIRPGTILLDATAAIDGLTQLELPGRTLHRAPSVTYEGLMTKIVSPPPSGRLSKWLDKHDNAKKYQAWVIETILKNTSSGERVLAVVRKKLTVDAGRYIPNWDRDDNKWTVFNEDPYAYHWDLEGRQVAVTWWGGDNIGNNAWEDAQVVCLFDADYKPGRIYNANVQGHLNAKPLDPRGVLADRTSIREKHTTVDQFQIRELRATHKQLALRGNARKFDDHGRCEPQLLVCGLADPSWLLSGWQEMFPGAPVPEIVDPQPVERKVKGKAETSETYASRVRRHLISENPASVRGDDLGLGKPWRLISKNLMTPKFKQELAGIGYTYDRGVFLRIASNVPSSP